MSFPAEGSEGSQHPLPASEKRSSEVFPLPWGPSPPRGPSPSLPELCSMQGVPPLPHELHGGRGGVVLGRPWVSRQPP